MFYYLLPTEESAFVQPRTLIKRMKLRIASTVLALALSVTSLPRSFASEAPPGLAPGSREEADFNHLSEGSDFFPYDWLMNLESATYKKPLASVLQNYGLIPDATPAPYLLPYVGLSVSWSDHRPDESDAYAGTLGNLRITSTSGHPRVASVRLMGINCNACHSGALQLAGGRSIGIPGRPSGVNVEGLFMDIALSTIGILGNVDHRPFARFLRAFDVPNPEATAAAESKRFLKELGEQTGTTALSGWTGGGLLTLGEAQLGKLQRLFKGRKAIADSLERLLRLTYHLSPGADIGELKGRMQFLGILFTGGGVDPRLAQTPGNWGRTDAFGRISNQTMRGDHPIGADAPVRFPWLWAIKYAAMAHYSANTNSVELRNVGQAMGSGAIPVNRATGEIDFGSKDTTVNMHGQRRLEELAYRMEVPRWEKAFSQIPEARIAGERLARGREIYESKCARCHEAKSQRVGPLHKLLEYKVYSLAELGTDPNAAYNVAEPVVLKDGSFTSFAKVNQDLVASIRDRYYETYFTSGYSAGERASIEGAWSSKALRGTPFFRDTPQGMSLEDQAAIKSDFGAIDGMYVKNGERKVEQYRPIDREAQKTAPAYRARHLAGAWAAMPFLHNGSVPTMMALLSPARLRPTYFNVTSRFDFAQMGIADAPRGRCEKKESNCFDTTLSGNHNSGHEGPAYGTDLSLEDKKNVIEYLKVLPPEEEYGWK
jgi:mono/diheme cytochrome c family protein